MCRMSKGAHRTIENGVVHIYQREVGELLPKTFARRLGACEDLVFRLGIYKNLAEHKGCVNTVGFNAAGDILISGSDDKLVMLWDWDAGRVKLSFHSGHSNNILQAKIIPFTNDQTIVTSAADGQVRHAQVLECGKVETVMLAKHQGRAHKLAIDPGSPNIFFSCAEDGLVQHFDLRVGTAKELFTCKSLRDKSEYMSIVHLNAIAIDPRNPNIFVVAGSDEYARLYDIRKYKQDVSNDFGQPVNYFCPLHLIGDRRVGITGLAFSDQRELLVSYNDEHIYLFTSDMGLGSDPSGSSPMSATSQLAMDTDDKAEPHQVYKGHKNRDTLKSVTFFGPGNEYVLSGSDCGRIFIWRKKNGELLRVMRGDKHVVNFIEPHPHVPMFASSGIEHDIKIWTPEATEKASLPLIFEQVLIPNRIACIAVNEEDDEDNDHDYYSYDSDIFSDNEDDDYDSNEDHVGT